MPRSQNSWCLEAQTRPGTAQQQCVLPFPLYQLLFSKAGVTRERQPASTRSGIPQALLDLLKFSVNFTICWLFPVFSEQVEGFRAEHSSKSQ